MMNKRRILSLFVGLICSLSIYSQVSFSEKAELTEENGVVTFCPYPKGKNLTLVNGQVWHKSHPSNKLELAANTHIFIDVYYKMKKRSVLFFNKDGAFALKIPRKAKLRFSGIGVKDRYFKATDSLKCVVMDYVLSDTTKIAVFKSNH